MGIKRKITAGLLTALLIFSGCCSMQTGQSVKYDKTALINEYGTGDLDSDLSVFPDDVDEKDVILFDADLSTGLFDVSGHVILSVSYSEEMFSGELTRLSGLKKTISFAGEEWTGCILYDESSYSLPAYVAIDGFGNTYEYALTDISQLVITYVYLAYPSQELLTYKEYLKKDVSDYEKSGMDSYSMYLHSFNGGESWVEFDDDIVR